MADLKHLVSGKMKKTLSLEVPKESNLLKVNYFKTNGVYHGLNIHRSSQTNSDIEILTFGVIELRGLWAIHLILLVPLKKKKKKSNKGACLLLNHMKTYEKTPL